MIENTVGDLARIPFIRENPVFQQFLQIEGKEGPFRSLALADTVSMGRRPTQKLSMSSNYRIPNRLTSLDQMVDTNSDLFGDDSPKFSSMKDSISQDLQAHKKPPRGFTKN